MAMMAGSLYDALRAGNVPDDKALKAAEEAAETRQESQRLDTRLTRLEWIAGTGVALQITTIVMLLGYALNHMSK